jgi:uncharacterized protein (DUF736 family)
MEDETKNQETEKEDIEEDNKKNKPSWRGVIDVAGWIKKDKNGKDYLSLKISQYCNLFKNN